MGSRMGGCMKCLAFSWVLSWLCALHLSVSCFESNLVSKRADNKYQSPVPAPVHCNTGAAPPVSGCPAAVARSRRAANTSGVPYKILKFGKRLRETDFVSPSESSSFTLEGVPAVASAKNVPEDSAHPPQVHPLVNTGTVPSPVTRGKTDSYTERVLPSLKFTRTPDDSSVKGKTAQNSDSTVSIPHLNSGTNHTSSDLKKKTFDTTEGSPHCSKLPANANLEHGQNPSKTRKSREGKVNSTAGSFKGKRESCKACSNKNDNTSNAGTSSRTRQSLSSYEGNNKTSSASSNKASHSMLETAHTRTTFRFDPEAKRAGSRSCWGSRRKNSAPCTDSQRRSGRSGSDHRNTTSSSRQRNPTTNTAVDRSLLIRSTATSNSRSTNSSGTKIRSVPSRDLGTKSNKKHRRKNCNGSSNSSTTTSNCSSVPVNRSKPTPRATTEEIGIGGATGHFRRSRHQRGSTDRVTQQRRPAAVIRLRLCHFTDFHSAYEFNKTHPLHKSPSCCPRDTKTSAFTGDNAIDQSTATCPSKGHCTQRLEHASQVEEDAPVVDGGDGGIWRVSVLQYILDILCPTVSPSSTAAFQYSRPTTTVTTQAPKPKFTPAAAAAAAISADAARWESANTPVQAETALHAKTGSNSSVRRDAFAVPVTSTVSEEKNTTGFLIEKPHGEGQNQQWRGTRARPIVKGEQWRKIHGYLLKAEASRKLSKPRTPHNKTSAQELVNENVKGRTVAGCGGECPMWTSSAGTESLPTTSDHKRNGGSGQMIRDRPEETNKTGLRPTLTKDSIRKDTQISSSERSSNADGPEGSASHTEKEMDHILYKVNNLTTNRISSSSNMKIQCNNTLGNNCRNAGWSPNSTSGSKDNSIPVKEGVRGFGTYLVTGTDGTVRHPESCSQQTEEGKPCIFPGLSERINTRPQEQRRMPVEQNGPEEVVQVVPYSLRLFGGDAVPGSDFDALGAELPGKLLKELKVQVATLGNHEFDRGWQTVDKMFDGNQNFTTFVVSNAFTNSSREAKPRDLSSTYNLHVLHDTTSHNTSTEVPNLQRGALSSNVTMSRHSTARRPTTEKETAPRHSTEREFTSCGRSFARHSPVEREACRAPRCAQTNVVPRLTRQAPFASAVDECKPSSSKTGKNVTHPSTTQMGERIHEDASTEAGRAFPLDNAGESPQQSEPDRSGYTVPYVLWLANVHGDFVLLKPQQLADIYRVCRPREIETPVTGRPSATAGGAAAPATLPRSTETATEAELDGRTDSFLSILKLKQPAAAVCLLGALPKDLRTSAAPPAEVDVSSENSTQRIELALRQCTESYWRLLRTCSEALQQPSRRRAQSLSRDPRLQEKMKQSFQPGKLQQHEATAQELMHSHMGQKSSSCADSRLGQRQQIKREGNRSERQQQQQQPKHRHAMAVRGPLIQREIDGSEKEQRGTAEVLRSEPHREQSEQQWRQQHVHAGGEMTAASTASKSSFPMKDNREGSPNEPPLPRPIGVLLSHLGFKEEQRVAAERGGAAEDIDFIFSGHSHTELPSHMFPAFVKHMKPGQMEAALTGDTVAGRSLARNVAAVSASGNHKDSPVVPTFTRADGHQKESRTTTMALQGDARAEDEEPATENLYDQKEVEEESGGQPQAISNMIGHENDQLPRDIQNTFRENVPCNNNTKTKQVQSSQSSKQMRYAENGHTRVTKQHSSLEKQPISCGRSKQYRSTKNRSRRAGQKQNRRSSFLHSNTWQSGSFIITSASHGKRISFVDIFLIVSDHENGETEGRTHREGEAGTFTEVEGGNREEDVTQHVRTDIEEDRQDMEDEGLESVTSRGTRLKDTARADGMDEIASHTDKSVWWLRSEQLPPVFSTVDVDDFAAWASSAKSFLGQSVGRDKTGTGRKTHAVSSQAAAEAARATGKAAPGAAVPQAESTVPVQEEGLAPRGSVLMAPGNRSFDNVEQEAWSNDESLQAPFRHNANFREKDKSHSQVPSQLAVSCKRSCNSNANTDSSLGNNNGKNSGALPELHGAVAYEFVCLNKTYGGSDHVQERMSLQRADRRTPGFMQSFNDTPYTTRNVGLPFNAETKSQWTHEATPQQKAIEALPLEPTPALTRRDESGAISQAKTNRPVKAVATEAAAVATKPPYFRCSPTTQPIPPLLWHSSIFSFSRRISVELARHSQPDQSSTEAAPAATILNSGSNFSPFVACVPQQDSNQSSAKLQDVYRLPYFGWLPFYSTQTDFAPPHSEQRHVGKQQQQQQQDCNSFQHLQGQNSSRQGSHRLQQQSSSCHRRHQQQQLTDSHTKTQPRRRHPVTMESFNWASEQQLRGDFEEEVPTLSAEFPTRPTDITPVFPEQCYRLISPVPLFPALSPPAQPYPVPSYKGSMQPAQSEVGFNDSSLLTGSHGADGAAGTGGNTDVAVAVAEAHSPVEHIFCRPAINEALVCPYFRTINKLRYERRTQTKSFGVTAAEGVDGSFDSCRRSECPMGRLVSDAMRYVALRALLWRPTSGNEYTAATQEVTEIDHTVPSATGETAGPLSRTVSILTGAKAIRRPGKGAAIAGVRETPSKRAASTEHCGRKFRESARRWHAEEQGKEQSNAAAGDNGAEIGRSPDMDELMQKGEGASYTLNTGEVERSGDHQKATERPAHITDMVRKPVDAPLRGKFPEGCSSGTTETTGEAVVSKSAPDGSSTQHGEVEKFTKKGSFDAEFLPVQVVYGERRPPIEQEKDGKPTEQEKSENVCATSASLERNRKETLQKSSRRSGKWRDQKKQQQQQRRGKNQREELKEKKLLWQSQGEEKFVQRRKIHQPVVKEATESARMLQQETEELVEEQTCRRFGLTNPTFLGVVALQTSGNIRSSFCPDCPLTDAEIENVLPWSSQLRVINLPIQDFLTLSSRSVQNLMNSGSCILNTPEATHLFPHLSGYTNAASEGQTAPEPKARLHSLPHHRLPRQARTARIRQEKGINNSVAAHKRRRIRPYSNGYSPCSSPRSGSVRSGNSACDRDSCAWKSSSENDNGLCGCGTRKRAKQDEDCTALPFCPQGERGRALQSPSILQMGGALVEVRLPQKCGGANHLRAAEAGANGTKTTVLSPSHMDENEYEELSSSTTNSCEEIQEDKSSCATLKGKPDDERVFSMSSQHAAKFCLYISVYPLSVTVEALQTKKTNFQYLFKGKGESTRGFQDKQLDEKSKKEDGTKTTPQDGGEDTDYLWIKVETTQMVDIRARGSVKRRRLGEERKATWGDRSGRENVSVVDDAEENNHGLESGKPEECNGWHREKKREKVSRTGCAERQGNNEDDKKPWTIHGMTVLEELKRGNIADAHKEKRNGRVGQMRKTEAEEAIEGEEEEGEPAKNRLSNAVMLPIYVQQGSLQGRPLLLQHLQEILRLDVAGAQTNTGTLKPCTRKSEASHGYTQSIRFGPASPSRRAAADNEFLRTEYRRTNEAPTLLPLCWVRQRITSETKERNSGMEQLEHERIEKRRRMDIGTSAIRRQDTLAAEGAETGQHHGTQIPSAFELRVRQTSQFHTDDELPSTVLHAQETKRRADSPDPGHTWQQGKAGARALTKKQVSRKGKIAPQIASALASRNRSMRQRETTGVTKGKAAESNPSEEEPAVVPLSSIQLLGVVDQFFLQGGDQLLLDDDQYTFNVTSLPAVDPNRVNAENNSSTPLSERRKGESPQDTNRHKKELSPQKLQKRQEGHHDEQRSQHEQKPCGPQHRGTFLSGNRRSLAVEASFHNKTARDALAEFVQMKRDRNERIGANSLQRLLIRLGN